MIQTIQLGDSGYNVRQSRIALIRFLRERSRKSTRRIRMRLRFTHRRSKATPTWALAVKAAQQLLHAKQSGQLDPGTERRLRPFWPRDSLGRRLIRKTSAWRIIPGQLTRNFNIREFGCRDGTGYIGGLARETGISRAHAHNRAVALATRLERVRAHHRRPLRIVSGYRTKSYNARIGGASNSAHTRGYAADVPPPASVSLSRHRRAMRQAFEGGIGTYPGSGFVHGDFDPLLGRREWVG